MNHLTTMDFTPAKYLDSGIAIYEYGCRLDKNAEEAVWDQIRKSRALYNELVAAIRRIADEAQVFVMERAGAEAQAIQKKIDELSAGFAAAKAADDEATMKAIAEQRRDHWKLLSEKLREVRKTYKQEIASGFLSRIGKKSTCETYILRGKAVADGLGWATANAILDAALNAFKKSFALGRKPRFASGSEKEQDCLTLQFTAAGGVSSASLLGGTHGELCMLPPEAGVGRRRYGEFRFRLGAAKAETYATGTWQYHRPLPEGSYVGLARLVRRRIGKDFRYALQLMVKQTEQASEKIEAEKKPLVAMHFGWATDVSGRRVAGLADSADPGAATLLQLPAVIEETLHRADDIQGSRDTERNEIVPKVKNITLPQTLAPEFAKEWDAIKRLPVSYVSPSRLHHLCRSMREHDIELPEWLEAWRKADRLCWQAHTHLAKRARNARKTFYREQAAKLAKAYSTIAIEPLDLATAAMKVDDVTGEKNDLSRKARSGRVVAAIYELESAIRWAAAKHGCAVLEVSGKTASVCSICGGCVQHDNEDMQVLTCDQCGAQVDRKQNGAALVFQTLESQLENAVEDYWINALAAKRERVEADAMKKQKLVEARAKTRTASAGENAGGTRA